MSKFLGPEGYQKISFKGTPLEGARCIRRMEDEIKRYMKEGATLPEAVYCIVGILDTAAGNYRYKAAQANQKQKKKKKS